MSSLCISSLVVHPRPSMLANVREWINAIPEAEVYGKHEEGKLVVVLDTANNQQAKDKINDIQNRTDILSTTLIYQYNEE